MKTTHGQRQPRILTGIVVDVDAVHYTATIRPSTGGGLCYDVGLFASQIDPQSGSGDYVIPSIGSQVLYCYSSEAMTRPQIIAAIAPSKLDGTGSRDAGRGAGTPGDLLKRTAGGSFVNVFRSGTAEIGGSRACVLSLDGRSDRATLLTTALEVHTPGTLLRVETLPSALDPDGKIGVRVESETYPYVTDAYPAIRAVAGALDDPSLLATVSIQDTETGAVHTEAQISASGSVRVATDSMIEVSGEGETVKPVLIAGAFLADQITFLTALKAVLVPLIPSLPMIDTQIAALQRTLEGDPSTGYASARLKAS